MCSECNEHHHDEDCCCCECCKEEKELVRDRRELTDEEIESIIVEKYNTKDEKTKVFIRKALKVHGNKYDYSKSIYINNHTKIIIYCSEHGFFEQDSDHHIRRHQGCRSCGIITVIDSKRYTKDDFICKAKEIHGEDTYNYSKVNYVDAKTKVIIHCNKHNIDFEQNPHSHLRGCGCPECGLEKCICDITSRFTKEDFINRAIEIHGEGMYDYSEVDYVNSHTDVKILCKKCGEYFYQRPNNHINGQGCPNCHIVSRGEEFTISFLNTNNISFKLHKGLLIDDIKQIYPDFVLINKNVWIEYNGIQHYKYVDYYHNDSRKGTFLDQLNRDIKERIYCLNNNIKLIEISYIFNTYEKVSDFLDKVLFKNIDPNTLVDYKSLYKLDNTGLNLVDLFPTRLNFKL